LRKGLLQKGIGGMFYSQSDMMITESGIVPDLVMNPHAIPSRMTVSQMIEGLAGKLCAINGSVTDGTIFKKVDIEAIGDELEKHGFDRHGNERMYNGMTGEWINCTIFIAPMYYQRLQKFVIDDMYSISTGPTCALTRQPLGGKASLGGLKVGEMERDALISHGSARMLTQKFFEDSDGFRIYICRTCGNQAVVNLKIGEFKCMTCVDDADIFAVDSSWSSNLFINELKSMGIGIRTRLKPYEF